LRDGVRRTALAAVYQPRGTAPLPAALLAMVTVLQAYDQVSDVEAVVAARVDQQWQLVLGCLGTSRAPFSQGAPVKFRERMIAHNLDQRLLDRTVAQAKQSGRFGWQTLRAALVSSPLIGRGRVEDNSARSQMSEGLLRSFGGDRFEVFSAGTKPSIVRSEAIAVMSELAIDLSGQRSKHVREFEGQAFDYVITVCDDANESCPVFPGKTQRIHWSFPDPAGIEGSDTERLAAFRRVRDALAEVFRDFANRVAGATAPQD
jgi:arsenate reductase